MSWNGCVPAPWRLCAQLKPGHCCSQDYILPELRNDDWLVFPRMGAYTLAGASKFNGINAVDVPTFYVASG